MARLVSDEEYSQLKAKEPKARRLNLNILGDQIQMVVRPATLGEFEAFKELNANTDPKKNKDARKQLLIFCLLSPDPKTPELGKLLAEYPGIPDTVWPKLGELVGLGAGVELGE